MQISPRRNHVCGLVGNHFVAVGGENNRNILSSVELINVHTLDKWVQGPELPYKVHAALSVIHENELMVIGGMANKGITGNILSLSSNNPNKWKMKKKKLKTPRGVHASVLIPSKLLNC